MYIGARDLSSIIVIIVLGSCYCGRIFEFRQLEQIDFGNSVCSFVSKGWVCLMITYKCKSVFDW